MPTKLTTVAKEEGTYAVTIAFTDEDGASMVPNTIEWTLTDTHGTVINNRAGEVVATPAASVTIVLSGDDLQVLDGETGSKVGRYLTVSGDYTSSLGAGLPFVDSCYFQIENLVAVPAA